MQKIKIVENIIRDTEGWITGRDMERRAIYCMKGESAGRFARMLERRGIVEKRKVDGYVQFKYIKKEIRLF